jgi:hypothetical protein
VYESQVPLWYRAVLRTGCVAHVARSLDSAALAAASAKKTFKLADVEMINLQAHPYLEPQVAQYRRLFVYYVTSASTTASIGILGLFVIDSTNVEEAAAQTQLAMDMQQQLLLLQEQQQRARRSRLGPNDPDRMDTASSPLLSEMLPDRHPLSGRAHVWLINGRVNTASAAFDVKPPFQRLYRKFQPSERGVVKFVSSTVGSSAEALRQCNERIASYAAERRGPTVVVAQGGAQMNGNRSAPRWRSLLPALKDFPLCVMPANTADEAFPAVG